MDIIYEKDGAKERIIENALALSNGERNERVDRLYEVTLQSALSHCNRSDVPYLMEGALSIMLADLIKNGDMRAVKTVKRGDVSVTYGDENGGADMKGSLSAFVRMRSV